MSHERVPRQQQQEQIARMLDVRACRLESTSDYCNVLLSTHSVLFWRHVQIVKNQFDLARYFHLLAQVRPAAVVETGLQSGGSALFFMDSLEILDLPDTVYIGVDLDCQHLDAQVLAYPHPHVIIKRDCLAVETVAAIRQVLDGRRPILAVLDSVHTKVHVDEELRLYAPLVPPGSHLVVEDTDHNGHPVLANYGPSAWEAVQAFMADGGLGQQLGFEYDRETESLFARVPGAQPFTNSPSGWLVRR